MSFYYIIYVDNIPIVSLIRLAYNDYSDKQQHIFEREVMVMTRLKRELMDRIHMKQKRY